MIPKATSILAVLVLYGKQPTASATLQSLAAALHREDMTLDLLLYDNSPVPLVTDPSALSLPFKIHYCHDPSNPGVSAAFNAGAKLARQMGKEWLLLLDQDTVFPQDAVDRYLSALRDGGHSLFAPKLTAEGRLLSPCGYLAGIGYHLRSVDQGSMRLEGRSVLNSGLLVALAAFEAVGGYDENVRVDFADFTFLNRFRRLFSEINVVDMACRHGFSNLEMVPLDAALRRFSGYCRDGRAAAITPLLILTHAFLVLRRCAVLTLRYGSIRFLPELSKYFSKGSKRPAQ